MRTVPRQRLELAALAFSLHLYLPMQSQALLIKVILAWQTVQIFSVQRPGIFTSGIPDTLVCTLQNRCSM